MNEAFWETSQFWIFWGSAAIFFSGLKAKNAIEKYLDTKKSFDKRKAYDLYVTTGAKTRAFNYLSRTAVKTAERKRKHHVAKKAELASFFTFSAYCECPNCGLHMLHNIEPATLLGVELDGCLRECIGCSFKWRQK